jgi:hypothetical protein
MRGRNKRCPMPTETAVIVSTVSAAIAFASAIIAVLSYRLHRGDARLARHSFADDHDYRRRVQAVQLLIKWDEMTLLARKVIMSRWEKAFNENLVIPWSEIEEYRGKQIEQEHKTGRLDSKPRLITDHMAVLMNYFEAIASSILHEVASEAILRRHFENTFERWYAILTDYRRHVKDTRRCRDQSGKDCDPWGGTLDWLYQQWRRTDLPPLPKTGDDSLVK